MLFITHLLVLKCIYFYTLQQYSVLFMTFFKTQIKCEKVNNPRLSISTKHNADEAATPWRQLKLNAKNLQVNAVRHGWSDLCAGFMGFLSPAISILTSIIGSLGLNLEPFGYQPRSLTTSVPISSPDSSLMLNILTEEAFQYQKAILTRWE